MFDGDAQQVKATCDELQELLVRHGVMIAKLPAADSLNVQLLDIHSVFRAYKAAFNKPRAVTFSSRHLDEEVRGACKELRLLGT